MSRVLDRRKCEQCGYEFGFYEFDCRSSESWFICRRCGHRESVEMITDDEGDCIGWRHDTYQGYGAYWCEEPGNGIAQFGGLHSARQVDKSAQKMWELIAKGELDGERSYVTRWDADAERVEVIAGRWKEENSEDDCGISEKGTRDAS